MSARDSFIGRLLGNADMFTPEQVAQTITLLLEHGVTRGASDIHIEPQEHVGIVRYRIDGVLRSVHKIPLPALPAISDELKNLAHIQPNDFMPGEGHYSTLIQGETFEVQLTSLPVVGGEKITMRLSRRLTTPPSLEALGFWGPQLDILNRLISRPHGVVLASGPKRSGKATTLYSIIHPLATPIVSIATLEESISYRLPGVNQTETHPRAGLTYHAGLQAILNQDPNIILLGSIPDKPTAHLAVDAGAHGHLVAAGVYAPSAAAAATHLRSLQTETFLLGSALRVVVSQRLVRTLCQHCREAYELTSIQHEELARAFGVKTAKSYARIHELEREAAAVGLGGKQPIHSTPAGISTLWRSKASGCGECNHSGFKGMVAVAEVMEMTPKLQQALLRDEPADELHRLALTEDFVPLGLDGLVKALRGITTIEEVLRVLPHGSH